jgi:hypothetical protein
MSLPRSRHSFAVACLVVLTLGASACVKQNAPGVGLVKFDSSAVFGIPTKTETPIPGFEPPDNFSDFNVGGFVGTPVTAKAPDLGPCPPAKLTAFPKTTATPNVVGMPAEGIYKWKRDLFVTQDLTQDPPVRARLGLLLQSRAIRRVQRQSDHQFSFEMVQTEATHPDLTVVTQFRVNTNPEIIAEQDTRNVNTGDVPVDGVPQVSRDVPGTIGVVDVPYENARVTNPADAPGVFILGIETRTKDDVLQSSFTPVQPMLILPLDGGIIRSGQTFRSVGISQSDQSVLVNDGTVGRTNRIDACGEIAEGYQVTLKQTLSTDVQDGASPLQAASNQQTREQTFTFATQLGALPIADSIAVGNTDVDPIAFYGSWSLGGLTPTPLPEGLK